MDYDKNEARRRRELDKALAAKIALEAKLAEVARQARSAKARLLATTKSESWHRHALAWHDRDAGYTGEMASARVYLRSLPIRDYIAEVAPHAEANPGATMISIEVAAVRANMSAWTQQGDDLLLDRARRDYVAEVASFRQWEKDNPDKKGWREQPSTRTQWFQISRNAQRLGIDTPTGLNRGQAHDWIEAHGGNLRLVGIEQIDAGRMANLAGSTADLADPASTNEYRTPAAVLDTAASAAPSVLPTNRQQQDVRDHNDNGPEKADVPAQPDLSPEDLQ